MKLKSTSQFTEGNDDGSEADEAGDDRDIVDGSREDLTKQGRNPSYSQIRFKISQEEDYEVN